MNEKKMPGPQGLVARSRSFPRQLATAEDPSLALSRDPEFEQPDEFRFRRFVETTATGFAVCSRDLRILTVNSAYARISGLSPEMIEGRPIADVIGAQAFQTIRPYLDRVLRGEHVEYEAELPYAANPHPRFVHVTYTPDLNADGQVVGWVAAVRDITPRKRAEKLALEQKRVLQMIATGRPLEECLAAITTTVTRLCPKARAAVLIADAERDSMERAFSAQIPALFPEDIHGAPVNELAMGTCGAAVFEGRTATCSDIVNDQRWSKPWRDLCVARGVLSCHSTPILAPDGRAVASFLLCFGEPHQPDEWERSLGEFGAGIARIAIDHDRTARTVRETEHRLAADLADMRQLHSISLEIGYDDNAEDLYDKVLDAAVAVTKSDFGSIQMLYPERGTAGELRLLAFRNFSAHAAKFWEWLGIDSATTCGEALRTGQRVVVEDVDECAWIAGNDLAAFRETGIRATQSTPLISRGGKLLGMISTQWRQPHRPSESNLRALDILARQAADIIERKVAQERQKQSEAALRNSEKFAAAGRMAATVAHEINNPLESVVNLSYLLGNEDLSANGRELLRMLNSELNRVSHITKQTLEFYREGRTATVLDLREPINAAVTLFQRKAESQGATLEAACKVPAQVFGFAGELRQVFANLISNSLEANSTKIRIRVSCANPRKTESRCGVRVTFADNGSGISHACLAKLFEPFFTTKEEKGTGLGLWVSKGIVNKHGGWMRVRSSTQPGRSGTTFCLFFPTL